MADTRGASGSNPFAAPQVASPGDPIAVSNPSTVIVTVGLILAVGDLIICPLLAIRFIEVQLTTIVDDAARFLNSPSLLIDDIAEAGIILTAMPAALGLLARKRWALRFGYMAVICTAVSISLNAWASIYTHVNPTYLHPTQVPTLPDIVLPLFVRTSTLCAYVAILRIFPAYLRHREQALNATE
jgi:hypothetical protein